MGKEGSHKGMIDVVTSSPKRINLAQGGLPIASRIFDKNRNGWTKGNDTFTSLGQVGDC